MLVHGAPLCTGVASSKAEMDAALSFARWIRLPSVTLGKAAKDFRSSREARTQQHRAQAKVCVRPRARASHPSYRHYLLTSRPVVAVKVLTWTMPRTYQTTYQDRVVVLATTGASGALRAGTLGGESVRQPDRSADLRPSPSAAAIDGAWSQ